MATHLSSITGIGSSAKKLAALLQKKAPPGEKLAFINDREAALLKKHGGSGKEVEDTGIKSYDDTQGFDLQPTNIATGGANADFAGPSSVSSEPVTNVQAGGGESLAPAPSQGYAGAPIDTGPSVAPVETAGAPASQYLPAFAGTGETYDSFGNVVPSGSAAAGQADATGLAQQQQDLTQAQAKTPTKQPGMFGKAAEALGISEGALGRGLGGGLQALLGANQARQARAQGQQAKQEIQKLAAPYQSQGQQLQAQASAGQLTPANQQALQAAQAKMAQNVSNMGGVGAQQMQTQIAALTNNLLQQQMNLGLQLQQVGDKIAQGAITAGVQADQYVNQLTANYANNIARTVFGTAGESATKGNP